MTVAEQFLTLTPRDPLIARDGRPFGFGLRMKSLPWLYPSVLAGSLRTFLGGLEGGFETNPGKYAQQIERLKATEVAGPFPTVEGELYFPAPQDFIVRKNQDESLDAFGVRPVPLADDEGGCDLPSGLAPVLLPDEVGDDFKPATVPQFWACRQLTRWLANEDGRGFLTAGETSWPAGFLGPAPQDVRMHVQMEFDSGAGKKGMLFQSIGLDLHRFPRANEEYTLTGVPDVLAARVRSKNAIPDVISSMCGFHPLGGERRLIHWQAGTTPHKSGWTCPREIRDVLGVSPGSPLMVRMVLATPGLFRAGWRPGWLKRHESEGHVRWEGQVPETDVRVQLIGACVERWRPISGWSYETGTKAKPGPKAVRRLVPAGGVYFFQVLAGNPAELADRWLESVCDLSENADDEAFLGSGEQNRRDGFGLALWGVWKPFDESHTF